MRMYCNVSSCIIGNIYLSLRTMQLVWSVEARTLSRELEGTAILDMRSEGPHDWVGIQQYWFKILAIRALYFEIWNRCEMLLICRIFSGYFMILMNFDFGRYLLPRWHGMSYVCVYMSVFTINGQVYNWSLGANLSKHIKSVYGFVNVTSDFRSVISSFL